MVYLLNSDILHGSQKSTGFYLFIGKAGGGPWHSRYLWYEELSTCTCVLTSTSPSLVQQLNIITSNITWDFPLEERTQFLMENCLSLSRQGLHQAERAESFPSPCLHILLFSRAYHRIIKSSQSEEMFKITQSDHQPSTSTVNPKTLKPHCPAPNPDAS